MKLKMYPTDKSRVAGKASEGLQSAPNKQHQDEDHDETRQMIIYQAKMCEDANRIDDLVSIVNDMCHKYDDLTNEERNLLSFAYKNAIGSKRFAWKVINDLLNATTHNQEDGEDIVQDESHSQNRKQQFPSFTLSNSENNRVTLKAFKPTVIKSLLADIEIELKKHCNDILNILTKRLIPSTSNTGESKVFYYKMKGDFTRYLCETCTGNERKEKVNESLLAYKTASDIAMIELPPTHPVRLGLMLNFSVFYYEIMKTPERSCRLAKQAFDDAIAELDTLSEDTYKDSTLIMTLLRDNLSLWNCNNDNQLHQATPSNNAPDLIQQQ